MLWEYTLEIDQGVKVEAATLSDILQIKAICGQTLCIKMSGVTWQRTSLVFITSYCGEERL